MNNTCMHLKQGFLLKHFIYHLMENVWLLPQMPEMNKRKRKSDLNCTKEIMGMSEPKIAYNYN